MDLARLGNKEEEKSFERERTHEQTLSWTTAEPPSVTSTNPNVIPWAGTAQIPHSH